MLATTRLFIPVTCQHIRGIKSFCWRSHLVTVGGAEGMHVRSGPHELHHLHRLVRGSILSKPDGVVRHYINDAEPRQSTACTEQQKKRVDKNSSEKK